MSNYLARSYKQKYDVFLNDKMVKQESEYLHYFLPEFRKPLKLRMKSYDLDGKSFENRDFVVASVPEKKFNEENTINEDELNGLIEQSLLEVPISKLKREIAEETVERNLNSQAQAFQVEDQAILNKEFQLWTDKYLPKSFFELLSDDKINREVLTWLKTWDPVVFKKKV
jgi:DNA repair exonuclease SbcCD nuclease subunit